jgi:Tfp pilus assembly PilM family ATPase
MANLVALEWDGREARVAIASTRGNEAIVEEAFAIDLGIDASDEGTVGVAEIGDRLAEVCAERGLRGAETLVSLGRSNIELRLLSLPPAPPEEIPDMVRFQAMQAFTAIGEDWPLDFVELGADEESINVLAAVVSSRQVNQIKDVCASSELKPRCLVLRPFAAASLLNRGQVLSADRAGLVVDVLADGADLTAVSEGQVVFMRTVRLPDMEDANTLARSILGEIRRTIGAAQNQMGGRRIEQIVVCGSEEEHAILRTTLHDSLSLDVLSFDPFQAVRLGRSLRSQRPADSGRYAPLLGMLADEAAGKPHAIDFLNPRKRPAPPSTARRNLLIAATALTVVAVVTFGMWTKLRQLDDDIAVLDMKSAAMDEAVDAARALVGKADAVKEFTDGDITWLDEIHKVARKLPDADHVILDEVLVQTELTRGGSMILKGNVTDSDVIAEFEDSLRYNENIVVGRYGTIDRNRRDYPYTLDTTVIVVPDKQDRGRSLGRQFRDEMREDAKQQAEQAEQAEPSDADTVTPAAEPADEPVQPTENPGSQTS